MTTFTHSYALLRKTAILNGGELVFWVRITRNPPFRG